MKNATKCLFQGNAIRVDLTKDGIADLVVDVQGERANKLSFSVFEELSAALQELENNATVRALMISSTKANFCVGADLKEFSQLFAGSSDAVLQSIFGVHKVLNRLEDLPVPTACAINGLALGGGFELSLACDYRVMANDASIGQPEVNLGLIPGYGSTIRLPRLIGVDLAAEWIATGRNQNSDAAIASGAVDAIVAPAMLRDATNDLLVKIVDGTLTTTDRRSRRVSPIRMDDAEMEYAFHSSLRKVAAMSSSINKGPRVAIEVMQASAGLARKEAQELEARAASRIATTEVARSLIDVFLKKQFVKNQVSAIVGNTAAPKTAAVVGAGTMGSGIAYQSAAKGIGVVLKDVDPTRLDVALDHCSAVSSRQVARNKIDVREMGALLNRIKPVANYADLNGADIVVEAVAEDLDIKKTVLSSIETALSDRSIIVSNTSTIPISVLAESLERPENFCGMHFFNPVPSMPLVEVIPGTHTSDETISRVIAYALAMGKKPIVIQDTPGFLVNRLLTTYFLAFSDLLTGGARVETIDRAMRDFGWPMGPAQLLDVIGLDVIHDSLKVLEAAYPGRMTVESDNVSEALFRAGRFGQKVGRGYYQYGSDERGRQRVQTDDTIYELFDVSSNSASTLAPEEIVDALMMPMCNEAAMCLDEGVAESAAAVDLCMINGAAFPSVHGGPLHYLNRRHFKEPV